MLTDAIVAHGVSATAVHARRGGPGASAHGVSVNRDGFNPEALQGDDDFLPQFAAA